MNRCITADEEEGFALCLAMDERGNPFPDPHDNTRAAENIIRGKVEIKGFAR